MHLKNRSLVWWLCTYRMELMINTWLYFCNISKNLPSASWLIHLLISSDIIVVFLHSWLYFNLHFNGEFLDIEQVLVRLSVLLRQRVYFVLFCQCRRCWFVRFLPSLSKFPFRTIKVRSLKAYVLLVNNYIHCIIININSTGIHVE